MHNENAMFVHVYVCVCLFALSDSFQKAITEARNMKFEDMLLKISADQSSSKEG